MHPEEQYAVSSIRAGAAGYLTKESDPDELIDAIRKVVQGDKYITSSLAERLAFEVGENFKKPLHESLSDWEYQVMCMIASGKTVKEIAEVLSLSVKTISTHIARILKKMHMKKNASSPTTRSNAASSCRARPPGGLFVGPFPEWSSYLSPKTPFNSFTILSDKSKNSNPTS